MTPTIIWLPGFLCHYDLFSDVIGQLEDFEHEVVELPHKDTMAALASDLLQKIQARTFVLAGLSMGGILALEMYQQAAERIQGLILMNTNPKAENSSVSISRRAFIEGCEEGGLGTMLDRELIPKQLSPTVAYSELALRVKEMGQAVGLKALKHHANALESRPCYEELLKSISAPTLIVSSKGDIICPVANHLTLFEEIPHAELYVLSDCGHLSTIEKPKQVARQINGWLNHVI